MAKYNFLKNNFLVGEISPKSYGRTDLDQYRHTAKQLENFIIQPQGGIARRPGTEFIASQVNAFLAYPTESLVSLSMKCRLIPFIRSSTEAFCLVLRANTDGSAYTGTNSCDFSVMVLGDANARINSTFSGNRTRRKIVANDGGWVETYTSAIPNAVPVQFAGYSEDQIDDVKFTINGDFIVLTHPEVPPVIIQYFGGTSGNSFVAYPFYLSPTVVPLGSGISYISARDELQNNWPFRPLNPNATHTLAFSGTTGNVTVTSSLAFFDNNLIGATFYLAAGGFFEITQVASTTSATGRVITNLASAAATANWYESAWSNYRGWPRCATFHQNRLIYAGNTSQPQGIWASKIGDIRTLSNGAAGETDPISVSIASDDIASINWMVSGKNLNIGTETREIICYAPDSTAALSTGNIQFSFESSAGSAYVAPVKVGNTVTFLGRDRKSVREFVFNFQEDSFRSDLLSTFAEHMPYKMLNERTTAEDPAIIRMAFQGSDTSIIWFVDNNGGLFGCTRVRELGINGWHYHRLGGNLDGEDVKVEDVCILPNQNGTHDDVWLVVNRTWESGSANQRYIERIPQAFKRDALDYEISGTVHEDVICYADAQWTTTDDVMGFAGTPQTTFDWFDHLGGETVDVVGDGKYLGQYVVDSSGSITVNEAVSRVSVGLPYRAILETMPLEAGSVIGSGQTAIQKIDQVVLRFNKTVECKIGRDLDNLEDIIFRDNATVLSAYTPVFTGLKTQELRSVYSRDNTVVVVSDAPLPFELVSLTMRGITYD